MKKRFSEIRRLHAYLLTISPFLPPLPFQAKEGGGRRRREEEQEEGRREEEGKRKEEGRREEEGKRKEEGGWEEEGRREEEVVWEERKRKREEEEGRREAGRKALYRKMALEKYLEEVMKVEEVRNNRIVKDFFGL